MLLAWAILNLPAPHTTCMLTHLDLDLAGAREGLNESLF